MFISSVGKSPKNIIFITSREKYFKPKSSWIKDKAIDCTPNEVNLNFEKLSEIVNLFQILIWLLRQRSHKTHTRHLSLQIRHEVQLAIDSCCLVTVNQIICTMLKRIVTGLFLPENRCTRWHHFSFLMWKNKVWLKILAECVGKLIDSLS